MPNLAARLLGTWRVARTEEADFVDSMAVFRLGGELLHLTPAPADGAGGTRYYVMQLTYRVEGDELVTDQPSAPSEERVRFRLEQEAGEDRLWLDSGGTGTWYARTADLAL